MRWTLGVLLACLMAGLLIGLSRKNGSDAEAVRLLKAAAAAPRNTDYTARATTFASYGHKILHSEVIVYNAKGGLYRIEYRMGSLSGVLAGRSADGTEWRFDPLERHMDVEPGKGHGVPNTKFDLDLLLKNYRARVNGRETVAGRASTEVTLQPRSDGGSRSLWVDNETGVILRSVETNNEKKIVSATQFNSIRYGDTASPDQFLPIPPGGEPVNWRVQEDFAAEVTPEEIRKRLGMPLVKPAYLTPGFTLEGHYMYQCPGCNTRTAVTRYVNGLESLTVVQAPEECEQHMEKRPMNFGLGKAVFAKDGPNYFWVMGELPQSELERVSQSLKSAAK